MKNVGHIIECLLLALSAALYILNVTDKAIYLILLAIFLKVGEE